jgi:hypothetical protein
LLLVAAALIGTSAELLIAVLRWCAHAFCCCCCCGCRGVVCVCVCWQRRTERGGEGKRREEDRREGRGDSEGKRRRERNERGQSV